MGLFNKKKDALWASYNVGDLFDDKNDGTEYGEFRENWTTDNYHKKVANLSRVFDEIISRNTQIELACIQEVENEETLEF